MTHKRMSPPRSLPCADLLSVSLCSRPWGYREGLTEGDGRGGEEETSNKQIDKVSDRVEC